jgi:23S rRNA G2445 N2-methylase RlmL
MQKFQQRYFASCPVGLEVVLENEIQSFLIKTTKKQRGGVLFETFDEKVFELLFGSRVASRIFKVLVEFTAKGHKEMQAKVQEYKWSSLFSTDYSFKVHTIYDFSVARLRDSEWKNSLYTSLVIKDGILDHFKEVKGVRPRVEKHNSDLTFLSHIQVHGESTGNAKRDMFSISLLVDLCDEPLSHRGYRLPKMQAPLRENLAAGIIHMSGWPKQRESELLYDPFCGSGTIILEGILIKNRIPPSYNKLRLARKTSDLFWPIEKLFYFQKDEEISQNFNNLLINYYDQAEKAIEKMNLRHFACGDVNPMAQKWVLEQIASLGGSVRKEDLDFQGADFRDQKFPEGGPFCIITNPPYGERLDTMDEDLGTLYYDIGEWLKKGARNNRAYLFTKHGPHIKSIHLKPTRKEVITNGDFDCRLLNFDLY